MTTTTTGVLFVGKGYPTRPAVSVHKTDRGEFMLKLRLIDNQGPRCLEVYVARWIGEEAKTWHIAHPELKAGDALRLTLINPRSMPGAVAPEIHAAITACELLPARTPTTAQAS